jgi:hypothetical protein
MDAFEKHPCCGFVKDRVGPEREWHGEEGMSRVSPDGVASKFAVEESLGKTIPLAKIEERG